MFNLLNVQNYLKTKKKYLKAKEYLVKTETEYRKLITKEYVSNIKQRSKLFNEQDKTMKNKINMPQMWTKWRGFILTWDQAQ